MFRNQATDLLLNFASIDVPQNGFLGRLRIDRTESTSVLDGLPDLVTPNCPVFDLASTEHLELGSVGVERSMICLNSSGFSECRRRPRLIVCTLSTMGVRSWGDGVHEPRVQIRRCSWRTLT